MAIQIKYTPTGVEGLSRRELATVFRQSIEQVGKHWHKKYLPQHFGNAASRRYGYTLRQGEKGSGKSFRNSYTARKLYKYGHTRPLEFSGQGKSQALRRPNLKPTATSKKMAVDIHLPQKFNLRHPNSNVRMADEIRKVLPAEIKSIEQFLVRVVDVNLTLAGRRVAARSRAA